MDDTEITGSVDKTEPECPAKREDEGIVDAETNVLTADDQDINGVLSTSVNVLNRPLISLQMAETIRALSWPLISLQMAETIRALSWPSISLQMAETIRALSWPSISLQMAETIRALSWPSISLQMAETIRALSRPPVKAWYMEPISYLNLAPRVATAREEQEMRSASVVVDEEEYSLLEERSYWLRVFDTLVKDDGLRKSCRSLFADGYYAFAVERAYIYIDNLVSKRSGRSDRDGADLMRTVFSPKNPVLKFNNLQSRSEENQQQGYMHIFEGTMIGIRNPRAHEYDFEDSPEEALEMLVIASHLIRMLNRASSV